MDLFWARCGIYIGEIRDAEELKSRAPQIANDLAMGPVDFFNTFAAPLPKSSGPAGENGYLGPTFAARSIIAAVLGGEEFCSGASNHAVAHERLRPTTFVQLPLVKIEIEVPAGPQGARDRPKRLHEIGSALQVIDYTPFGSDQVNLTGNAK